MPGFWTADAPRGQLEVRIRPGDPPHDQERRLAVSSNTYAALRASLAQRQAAGNDVYASVVVRREARRPCVVRVIRDEAAMSGHRSAGGAQPVCVASGGAWAAIFGRGPDDDDAHDPPAATLEPIAPVTLSEIVLGVDSEQYADAQAAQAEISRQIASSPQVFSRGLAVAFGSGLGTERSAPVAMECLMCQPASQGVVAADGSTRVVIAKIPPQHQAGPCPGHSVPDACDTEQWDLGAEWFILGDVPLGSSRDRLVDAALNSLRIAELPEQLGANAKGPLAATAPGEKPRIRLAAVELATPPNSSRIVPGPYPGEDLENRGYLPLPSLAKTGIVSGSWVLIAPAPADGAAADEAGSTAPLTRQRGRAIRVFGWGSGSQSQDAMALPPLLFHKMCADQQAAVSLWVTPLGHPPPQSPPVRGGSASDGKYCLPLDTARKVVLARVSSPLSERRDLEQIALAALREWLVPLSEQPGTDKPLRVVQTGDLIAVRVAPADGSMRARVAQVVKADASRRALGGDHPSSQTSGEIDPAGDLVLDCSAAKGITQDKPRANELVFYRVAHAEGFRGRREPRQGPPSSGSNASDSEADYSSSDPETDYSDSGAGADDPPSPEWAEWRRNTRHAGLVIRPDVTMVSQTGATHGLAPYRSVEAYMAAAGGQPDRCDGGLGARASAAVPYSAVRSRLLRLARASLHPLAVSRGLTCAVLLKGNPGTGKRHLVRDISRELGAHLYELSCYDILSETEDKTAQVLQMYFQNARRYAPCVLHLRAIDALSQASSTPQGQEPPDSLPIARVLEACIAGVGKACRETTFPVIVVATSSNPDGVHTSLATAFRHEIELPVPDEETRLALLTAIAAQGVLPAADIDMAHIAQQTASFVARDLELLVRRAEGRAWRRARACLVPSSEMADRQVAAARPLLARDMLLAGVEITSEDLLGALGDSRASMSDTLGVPKIPNVKWEDVGGLADAKKDILDTIRLPMEQPHLFASGLSTRSGLLFYGPPGTGKTLLAKAIATECGLNFFSCKGPELISPYIGESEANVRRIFQKAREASPCVIFFDELDSLAPKRGQQGDSGGVMDRIVSQLLAELDGMSGGDGARDDDAAPPEAGAGANAATQVFAIGATNRPDLLDPALLRPGRFDKLVYLGVSETHDAQLNIIQALSRKFSLHPSLDLRSVAEKCPFHYTGADFYALCSDALLKAMLRTVGEVDRLVERWNAGERHEPRLQAVAAGGSAGAHHYPVPMTPQYYLDHIAAESARQATVTADDFDRALAELIPSVSADELARYQVLRRQFDTARQHPEAAGPSDTDAASGVARRAPDPPADRPQAGPAGSTSGRQGSEPAHQPKRKSVQKGKGKEADF